MYSVIECLTRDHDHILVAAAALVCVCGSIVSVMLSRRLLAANGMRKRVQTILSSLITGTTIWSTHFIAMLAYDPGIEHGYEPVRTGLSLLVAILGMGVVNTILGFGHGRAKFLFSGLLFGLCVATMHYVGMSAYLLPGKFEWSPGMVLASVLLGSAFGAGAYHRIIFPITRFCWLGGAAFMVLSICGMHFTGMAAITILLNPTIDVPSAVLSDATLTLLVFAVTALLLFFAFAALSIETNLEREALDRLEHTVTHDQLTGLPNRKQLAQKMQHLSAALTKDVTNRVGVLTINLKDFKTVNDLHGHAIGDKVLKIIARRLAQCTTEGEFVAHAGADEFVALKSSFRRIDEVMSFAERLHTQIVEPVQVDALDVQLQGAIGIATSINDGTVLDHLQQKSDLSMYRAKLEPERHIFLYNEELGAQSRDKLILINDMRRAIAEDQFQLAFQLQNDLKTLEPIGFEVLLRWKHPERGMIPPDVFIPIAEETGLIREIGMMVLRASCLEAATWDADLSIAVNVAPQQLAQSLFLENLSEILDESTLPPERLELEVTEASIIDDEEFTLQIMRQIKGMGVRIAMDDFGTGYSSLATLQSFPFDKIKIDKSFVRDVHLDHQRTAILRATLLLGDAMQIPVLAEGVETQAELDFLQSEGCHSVQGYYFGKPMAAHEIQGIVRQARLGKAS